MKGADAPIPLSIPGGSLDVDLDTDSSLTPSTWVWLCFDAECDPWFRLTLEEAAMLRDRLAEILPKEES